MTAFAILCIDDEPDRYRRLAALADEAGLFVAHAESRQQIETYLATQRARIVGICLDHDMCGLTGLEVAERILCEFSIPVVVTSANGVGATNIEATLSDYEVPVRKMPVTREGWEDEAVRWFRAHVPPIFYPARFTPREGDVRLHDGEKIVPPTFQRGTTYVADGPPIHIGNRGCPGHRDPTP